MVHPNPIVGSLIVENGMVVAEGYHHLAGFPYAEVEAIRSLDRGQRRASMLYPLNPVPPAVELPLCTVNSQCGIKHVYIEARLIHHMLVVELKFLGNQEFILKWHPRSFNPGQPD